MATVERRPAFRRRPRVDDVDRRPARRRRRPARAADAVGPSVTSPPVDPVPRGVGGSPWTRLLVILLAPFVAICLAWRWLARVGRQLLDDWR